MFVAKQVPVCNFILLKICLRCFEKGAFAFIFTLETVGFPACLLFLDSDKEVNQ